MKWAAHGGLHIGQAEYTALWHAERIDNLIASFETSGEMSDPGPWWVMRSSAVTGQLLVLEAIRSPRGDQEPGISE